MPSYVVRLGSFFGIIACLLGVTPAPSATPTPDATNTTYVAPSFDHPRKVVMSLSERDPRRANEVIDNVDNVQKYYGVDDVEIALVVYGAGINAVIKENSKVAGRIAGLIADGVQVMACANTLAHVHKTAADLLPGVSVVPSGLPKIIELQAQGWYYVRP